jgi:hypothetical protein
MNKQKQTIFLITLFFIVINFKTTAQDFKQTMLLDGMDNLAHYGLDTTGH